MANLEGPGQAVNAPVAGVAGKVIVQFQGADYVYDHELTRDEIERIRMALIAQRLLPASPAQ